MLFLKHPTSMQLLPRLSLSNLTWVPVVLIFQNSISLTLIIGGVFIRVVGTLYKPVLAVCDIPTAVSERILGRHKLVSKKRNSWCQCSVLTRWPPPTFPWSRRRRRGRWCGGTSPVPRCPWERPLGQGMICRSIWNKILLSSYHDKEVAFILPPTT